MRSWVSLVGFAAVSCSPLPSVPPVEGRQPPPSEESLLADRPYQVLIPPSYSASAQWPLLLGLHGYGRTGAQVEAYLGLQELARSRGYFLVAPDGTFDRRGLRTWSASGGSAPPFDVAYLLAIIHDLKTKYRIDPRRVFVVGYSVGAHMAHRLACDGADDVTAAVAIAGQLIGCYASTPVSVAHLHGTQDEAIGYEGDVNVPADPSVPSARETIVQWARASRCGELIAATGTTYDLVSDVQGEETVVEAYPHCPPGIAVELWTMREVTHRPTWSTSFRGAVSRFLDQHPRPIP